VKQSNKRTAAIYFRVAHEDDLAIEMQQKTLIQFAFDKGYINPVCYADNGVSGMTLNRPAFAELAKDIKTGKVNVVIVKDLSRIGRNIHEVMQWIEDCRNAGIVVISMCEGVLTERDERYQPYHLMLAAYARAKGGGRK